MISKDFDKQDAWENVGTHLMLFFPFLNVIPSVLKVSNALNKLDPGEHKVRVDVSFRILSANDDALEKLEMYGGPKRNTMWPGKDACPTPGEFCQAFVNFFVCLSRFSFCQSFRSCSFCC